MKTNLTKRLFIVIAYAMTVILTISLQSCGEKTLIPVQMGDKWGFIDQKGNYVINPQYNDVGSFSEGLAAVNVNGKYGFVDTKGNQIINARYSATTGFVKGLAFVVPEGAYPICINKRGKTVFELKNASLVFPFSEGLACVCVNGKWGYVDKTGKMIITPQFDDAASFKGGLALVKIGNKYGYIDKSGKTSINPQFEEAYSFCEGLAAVVIDSKCCFIDKSGQIVVNPQFDIALPFSEGLAVVVMGEKFGFIDKKGKIVVNPQFDSALPFSEGLAVVEMGEKCGFIDKKGVIVINPQFDIALPFSNGLSAVMVGEKWGFVDKSGKYIVNPQFEFEDFDEDSPLADNIILDLLLGFDDRFRWLSSEYYDASEHVSAFLSALKTDCGFGGFSKNSTLNDVVSNSNYENVNDIDKHNVRSDKSLWLLEDNRDITIGSVTFGFDKPVYRIKEVDYWFYTDTEKVYNFNNKISSITYTFNLSGEAAARGNALGNMLKSELSKTYNTSFVLEDGMYISQLSECLIFGLNYNNDACELTVYF